MMVCTHIENVIHIIIFHNSSLQRDGISMYDNVNLPPTIFILDGWTKNNLFSYLTFDILIMKYFKHTS